jgi:hypothetical protein
LLRGEYTIVQAAEQAGVDRSTIISCASWPANAPWTHWRLPSPECGRTREARTRSWRPRRPRSARLTEALKEMGVRLMLAEGKGRWD